MTLINSAGKFIEKLRVKISGKLVYMIIKHFRLVISTVPTKSSLSSSDAM